MWDPSDTRRKGPRARPRAARDAGSIGPRANDASNARARRRTTAEREKEPGSAFGTRSRSTSSRCRRRDRTVSLRRTPRELVRESREADSRERLVAGHLEGRPQEHDPVIREHVKSRAASAARRLVSPRRRSGRPRQQANREGAGPDEERRRRRRGRRPHAARPDEAHGRRERGRGEQEEPVREPETRGRRARRRGRRSAAARRARPTRRRVRRGRRGAGGRAGRCRRRARSDLNVAGPAVQGGTGRTRDRSVEAVRRADEQRGGSSRAGPEKKRSRPSGSSERREHVEREQEEGQRPRNASAASHVCSAAVMPSAFTKSGSTRPRRKRASVSPRIEDAGRGTGREDKEMRTRT